MANHDRFIGQIVLRRPCPRESSCCWGILVLVFLFVMASSGQVLTSTLATDVAHENYMFTLLVSNGVTIDSFEVDMDGGIGDFEIWALRFPGNYTAFIMAPFYWELLAVKYDVVGNPSGTLTPLNLNLGFDAPAGLFHAFQIVRRNGELLGQAATVSNIVFVADSEVGLAIGTAGPYFGTLTLATFSGAVHYTPKPTPSFDLEVSNIGMVVPIVGDCNSRSSTETISVELRNVGLGAVPFGSVVFVSIQVDSGPPIVETIGGVAFSSAYRWNHVFTATVDLSSPGLHTISATVSYAQDVNPSNDTKVLSVLSGPEQVVSTYPYAQEFNLVGSNGSAELPFGWAQETGNGVGVFSDWRLRVDAATTPGAGPIVDNGAGVSGAGGYAYVDDGGDHGVVAMRSPCFQLNGLANPNARLNIYSHNSGGSPLDESIFSMDVVLYPSNTVVTDFYGPIGDLGSGWKRSPPIDLAAFAGQTVQFVLRADTSGSGDLHDIAIDDFSVVDLPIPIGQAPRPGIASFEVNSPINQNQDPLSLGLGGPYFTELLSGSNVVFRMESNPFWPIVLLTGPLAPARATYPGIGILDLGGPVDPLTGIPSSISVVADGATPLNPLDYFFNTGASGAAVLGFTVPNLPTGVLGTFQCLFVSPTGIGTALSNAVQISIN